MLTCPRGPKGWRCSRRLYHEGPCALHARWWVRLRVALWRWMADGRPPR